MREAEAQGEPAKRPYPAALRVAELARIFVDRYGRTLPDDDGGRDDLRLVFEHLVMLGNAEARMRAFAAAFLPSMPAQERDDQILDVAMAGPRYYDADQVAWRIGLDFATRARLKITTIGAVDCNAEQRVVRRKEEHAARARIYRMRKQQERFAREGKVTRGEVRAVFALPVGQNTKSIEEYGEGERLIYRWLRGKGRRILPELADAVLATGEILAPIGRGPDGRKLDRHAIMRKLLRYCDALHEGGLVGWELVQHIRSMTRRVWRYDDEE